jgi:ketosteroid isomerase-like protein
MNDEVMVREANERFYRALGDLDLPAMEGVWAHEIFVRCVHPGWELIVGWEAVRASWEGIFQNTPAHSVTAADVVVYVAGELSWVSCIERIGIPERGGESFAVATNLFRRFPLAGDGMGWRMILHHASLIPVSIPEPLSKPEMVH